jgi:hypothetical protein
MLRQLNDEDEREEICPAVAQHVGQSSYFALIVRCFLEGVQSDSVLKNSVFVSPEGCC